MPGLGKPLHIRLFLEGIEIPVVAAQVSTHLNGPAVASIQVVPLDEALHLKPRTMVHLFFREKPATEDPDTGKLENYRLLFTGEIVGVAWVQSANMRSVVFQCLDFSSYWDAAMAASIDYGPQGDAFTNQAALVGASVGILDNVVNFEPMKLVEWIRQPPQTPGLQGISGLAGGAIRMLEALSGIRNLHRGINDFFTIGELRCRILEQICAEEHDNTAYVLLKAKVFDEWVRQGLQNIGQQVSFRQMLILLFKYIYHDFVANPAAKYDAAIEGTSTKKTQKISVTKIQAVGAAAKILAAIDAEKTNQTYTVETARGQAGTFAKALKDISTALKPYNNFPSVRRALQKIDNAIALLQDVQKSGNGANLQSIKEIGQAAKDLESADETRNVTTVKSDATTARLRSHILRPDCWFAPPPRCNVVFPEHYTDLSYDRTFISETTRMLLFFNNTLVGQDILLATKIMAPSNSVEATKLIEGAKGSQSFRLLMKHELHTGIVAKIDWVPNTAAPVSEKTRQDDANKIAGAKLSWGNKIALFNFFKDRFASRQASVSGRFNPYLVCGFPGLVIKRPYMINGLSKADNSTDDSILAQIQDSDFAQQHGAPSQLLGMINSLTHNISQGGGTTSFSMNYVREHLGVDDEFLGVFSKTKEGVKKRVRSILRLKDLVDSGSGDLEFLINSTPQLSVPPKDPVIQRNIDLSTVFYSQTSIDPESGSTVTSTQSRDVSRTTESTKDDPSKPYITLSRIDGLNRDVWVPTSSKLVPGKGKGRFGGTIAGIEVLDPNVSTIQDGEFEGSKAFGAVALYEDVILSSTKSVAVEEIIRPDWFSQSYQNARIGTDIYDPFFGTGSIIDDITVESDSTSSDTGVVTAADGEDRDALLVRLDALDGKKSLASIEKAVNLVGYLYGVVKAQDQDIDSFITQYTHRPIAGLADMLGDNVAYTIDGTTATAEAEIEDQPFKVGFHTHAVHPETASRGQLVGLIDDPNLQKLPRVDNTGKPERIPPSYDVRNEKWDRVLAYFEAIRNSPGGFRG